MKTNEWSNCAIYNHNWNVSKLVWACSTRKENVCEWRGNINISWFLSFTVTVVTFLENFFAHTINFPNFVSVSAKRRVNRKIHVAMFGRWLQIKKLFFLRKYFSSSVSSIHWNMLHAMWLLWFTNKVNNELLYVDIHANNTNYELSCE